MLACLLSHLTEVNDCRRLAAPLTPPMCDPRRSKSSSRKVRKTYIKPDGFNVTVPWFDAATGQRLLFRHPLNNRGAKKKVMQFNDCPVQCPFPSNGSHTIPIDFRNRLRIQRMICARVSNVER